MSNLIGHSLGRYQVLEQLGEGGMAIVYKAYDTRLEREVAVKIIRTERLTIETTPNALKRFEREAKALGKLTHPNIVPVSDYGENEGKPYLVMPYLPSGTLKQKMEKPIPWQEAIQLLLPIAEALDYAHSQNMIHRDVKPSNILLTQRGQPMLTDFGIAKILDLEETQDLTGTGVGIGTPEYMAPEQATSKAVDHRADIYSLGIVFYEMVTGRKPYIADTPMAVLIKHATEPLPRPKQFVPNLPDGVEQVLLKALAKKPEDRYQDMGEVVNAFEKLQRDGGRQSVIAPKPASESKLTTRSKIPMMVLGLAVVVLLAVFGLSSLIKKPEQIPATQKPEPIPAATSTESLKIFTPIPATEMLTLSPTSTLSPIESGKILEFCSDGNDWCIYKHPEGTTRLGLAPDYVVDSNGASWSPDGSEIVFSGCRLSDIGEASRCYIRSNLFVTSQDGTQVRPLLTGAGINAIYATWSPDGKLIAFHQMGSLAIIQSDGKGLKKLTANTAACPNGIAWSPDSSRIAWIGGTCNPTGDHRDTVWVINRDGTAINTIYKSDDTELASGQIAWSPDGKSVAAAMESGVVYLIDASCSNNLNGCDESSRTTLDKFPIHWLHNFYPQWAGEQVAQAHANEPLATSTLYPTGVPVSSISGNLILPQAFPGEKYEVYLDNDWDRGNGIIVSVEGVCSSSELVVYTISNVPIGGPYYLYAFVPKAPSKTIPSHSGYYGSKDGTYGNATLIDISDSSSRKITGYNISLYSVGIEIIGRLITPSDQSGKKYTAYIDTDTNPENGYVSMEIYTFGSGLVHNFGMGGQIAGKYYYYVISAELKGYYGSNNGDPSNAQEILISPFDTTIHDIKMFEK